MNGNETFVGSFVLLNKMETHNPCTKTKISVLKSHLFRMSKWWILGRKTGVLKNTYESPNQKQMETQDVAEKMEDDIPAADPGSPGLSFMMFKHNVFTKHASTHPRCYFDMLVLFSFADIEAKSVCSKSSSPQQRKKQKQKRNRARQSPRPNLK